MKVTTKLTAAFGALVITLAGLLIYQIRASHGAVLTNFELSETSSRLYLATTRQINLINQLEENAGKFWVTRDDGYLQLFRQTFTEFEDGLEELEANAPTVAEREEIARLRELWRAFGPVAQLVTEEVLASDPLALALNRDLTRIRTQTRRVSDASQAATRERLEASAVAARRAERISWMAGAATLFLSLLVFTVIVRSIASALNRLQEATREVALGNFDYRVPADRGDEFAQLGHEFNRMTRRLGELDRMKRDFLSKVSHDLKTPLASMRETVQLMLDGVPGPLNEKQERLLELTNQSGRRVSSMITKILELSAIEAGALALEIRRHEMGSIVESAVETLAVADPERHPRIVSEPSDPPVVLDCDHECIVQVVVNLLENAVKFSPADSTIRVRARLVEDGDDGVPRSVAARVRGNGRRDAALIEVSDQGPGVADQDKSRIFERFYQSSNGNRVAGRGVGLGLAICREIVELHGGSIWVRDRPEGGSTFCVLLPAAAGAELPVAAGHGSLKTSMAGS